MKSQASFKKQVMSFLGCLRRAIDTNTPPLDQRSTPHSANPTVLWRQAVLRGFWSLDWQTVRDVALAIFGTVFQEAAIIVVYTLVVVQPCPNSVVALVGLIVGVDAPVFVPTTIGPISLAELTVTVSSLADLATLVGNIASVIEEVFMVPPPCSLATSQWL